MIASLLLVVFNVNKSKRPVLPKIRPAFVLSPINIAPVLSKDISMFGLLSAPKTSSASKETMPPSATVKIAVPPESWIITFPAMPVPAFVPVFKITLPPLPFVVPPNPPVSCTSPPLASVEPPAACPIISKSAPLPAECAGRPNVNALLLPSVMLSPSTFIVSSKVAVPTATRKDVAEADPFTTTDSAPLDVFNVTKSARPVLPITNDVATLSATTIMPVVSPVRSIFELLDAPNAKVPVLKSTEVPSNSTPSMKTLPVELETVRLVLPECLIAAIFFVSVRSSESPSVVMTVPPPLDCVLHVHPVVDIPVQVTTLSDVATVNDDCPIIVSPPELGYKM